jgi:hypothetical protein
MAKMSEKFGGSGYLTANDVGPIRTELEVAVHEVTEEEVKGAEKTVVYLASNGKRLKPYIINPKNGRTLAAVRDDTEDWPGWRLTLKIEETSYDGKPTAGIWLYPAPEQFAKNGADSGLDDEVPFR